jgi:hypothetical protein
LYQKAAELVSVSSVFFRVRNLSRSGSRGSSGSARGSVSVAGQGTRNSSFSCKIFTELGDHVLLDVYFLVEFLGEGMIVVTGRRSFGFHGFRAFFEISHSLVEVFEE